MKNHFHWEEVVEYKGNKKPTHKKERTLYKKELQQYKITTLE